MLLAAPEFAITPPIVIGPLIAAVLFALGATALKLSAKWQVGVWRTTFLCNFLIGIVYLPGMLIGDLPIPWHLWWQPPVVGLLYLTGQTCTVLALTQGDVSVAGPMLALKILAVALLVTLFFGTPLPTWVWTAVLLATVGVAMLNWGGKPEDRRRAWWTAGVAGVAAVAFAMFDSALQLWTAEWGSIRFLSVMFATTALASFSFVPGFNGKLSEIPRAAWPTVAAGVGLLASQSMVFGSTIAIFAHATECNVIYSSRGLWSVLVVVLAGRWLGAAESRLPKHVLITRIIGATLMLASIVLLVL